MHLKNLPQSVKIAALALLMGTSGIFTTNAAVSYYESMDMGFISNTFRTASGLMATSNRGTEIYLLKDNTLTPVVTGPGAGMYVNVSKDGKLVGFKSIDAKTGDQAPAVMDATTGAVRLLESYSNQCGQVSFADDGTMAYTVGNTLYVVGSGGRHTYNLGLYTNIANISPDGTRVAYCDINGVAYILTVANGNIEQVSNLNSYNPIWSADGKKLAVQQSNGGLYSMDLSTMTVYPLGEANSVKWVDNTNELVITRSERVNDFEVKGASVVKMNFKGGDQTILVSLDESTPVSASLDGKELIVSYASGDLRGVTSTTFSSGVRAGAPAKVRTLLKGGQQRIGGLQANNFMGKTRPDFSKMSDGEIETFESGVRKASAAQASLKGGTIGLTAIPYINQVWDTPPVGGNYNYGYVCCAPSSSCMMLGYYGKVSPHGVASRSSYAAVKTCNYSWYVSQQYTSCTGYTFSLAVNAGGYWGYSYGVRGGHGYMWGNGSPASHMRYFHTNNGAKSSYYESSNAALDRECNANRPYIMCLNNGTGGHVVCCFRSNQIAANDGSSAWAKTGSFVCHDPYGDYNSSSYPNWDGRYSSYDLPGYSNGRANIGAFYWGCVSNFGDTPQTLKPEITTNPANVHFSCMLNEHPSTTVNVTGKDLSADITVASITPGRFSVSTDKLSKTGGSFTITFNISDKAGTYGQGGTAVDYSFFVRLKSGSTEKVLNITADVKAPPLETLTEKYNYSRKRNNINDKGYDMSKIRNFCYKDGKLYCVYDSKQILVLNAQTGDKLGFLSNGSVVTPSAATLADVKCIDGVIVASNIALAANGEKLRLYAWENDNAAPYLLLETADFQGSPRIGDCLEMTGSFNTDCWFAFANDWNGQTRIIEYNRKDGNWLAKNTPVYKSDGKTYATGATVRAYPKGGGWWIDGKNSQPAWTTWDDSKQGAVVQTTCDVDFVRGSSHHEFYWKGYKYAANLNFTDNSGTNCKMRIVQDPTGNFSQKTEQGQYPSDGLGDGSNTNMNGTGDVMINTDGQTYLEAWVLSTNHGLAYFTTGDVPAQNPQPINPTEETKDPVLSANPTSLSLAANVGEASNDKITVTGTNLQGSITMYLEGNDASSFSISPTGLSASGEVNVNYHPSAAGDHNTTLVITSPNAADVRVALSGTASVKEEFVDDIPAAKIQTVWESSQNAGTKSWHNATDANANYARAIAYRNGKLYVVQNKSWAAPEIVVLNAYNGEKTGNLSVTGITGATIQLGDITAFDGKIIGTNVVTAAQTFKLYVWDDDNAAPRAIKELTGVSGNVGGASVAATGTWNSGRIYVGIDGGNKIAYFDVNGGNVGDIHFIDLKKADGTAFAFSSNGRGTTCIVPMADGTFWINNYNYGIQHVGADGKVIETMKTGSVRTTGGAALAMIDFGAHKYLATTDYTSAQTGGKFVLVKVTDGIAGADQALFTAPDATFSSTANDQKNSQVILVKDRDNGHTLDMWAHVTKGGIAHYSYKGASSGVDNIIADETDAPVEYYNLQGVRVAAENLSTGIYIRRQGSKATKVLIR